MSQQNRLFGVIETYRDRLPMDGIDQIVTLGEGRPRWCLPHDWAPSLTRRYGLKLKGPIRPDRSRIVA